MGAIEDLYEGGASCGRLNRIPIQQGSHELIHSSAVQLSSLLRIGVIWAPYSAP